MEIKEKVMMEIQKIFTILCKRKPYTRYEWGKLTREFSPSCNKWAYSAYANLIIDEDDNKLIIDNYKIVVLVDMNNETITNAYYLSMK